MAEKFDEFMEEVERDIRHEQYEKLWKKYGKFVTSGTIVALLCSAAWMYYSGRCEDNLNLTSSKYNKATALADRNETKQALSVLESITPSDSQTYAALAQIEAARLMAEKGGEDFTKAQNKLLALSDNTKIDPVFKDFATFLYVKNEIDHLIVDDTKKDLPDATIETLKGFMNRLEGISSEHAPWRLNAMDLKGLIAILLKDYGTASEIYIKIGQDVHCPQGLKIRSEMMAQHVAKKLSAHS